MANKRRITVAGIQLLHEEGQREANIDRAASMIRSAPGHDLYVLPELASSGYGAEAFKQLDCLAEDRYGPSFQAFSALAREQQCYICFNFPRRVENDKPTICAGVVDRSGELVAHYDKWHVCGLGECGEKTYFSAGNAAPTAFSIDGIRVGICICYDIRFPELARKLAVEERAVLLIHPGGWPRDEGFRTWHTFVSTRAIENSMYVLSPNRAGPHNGCSIFCPPFVDYQQRHPITLQDEEAVLVGEVDLGLLERVRQTYPILADRRPDLYATHSPKGEHG